MQVMDGVVCGHVCAIADKQTKAGSDPRPARAWHCGGYQGQDDDQRSACARLCQRLIIEQISMMGGMPFVEWPHAVQNEAMQAVLDERTADEAMPAAMHMCAR